VKFLILLIAGALAAIGLAALIVPDMVVASGRRMVSPAGLYAAAAFRVGISLVLLLAAPKSRAPGMLRAVGFAGLTVGVATPLLGIERAIARLAWEAEHTTFLRIEGVVFIWLAFLIVSLTKSPSKPT
jgi:hypothetical protein